MNKFETGKVYSHSWIGDSNLRTSYKILKKTKKTLTIINVDEINENSEARRVKINVGKDGEYVYPTGKYSMAPILKSENIVEKKQKPINNIKEIKNGAPWKNYFSDEESTEEKLLNIGVNESLIPFLKKEDIEYINILIYSGEIEDAKIIAEAYGSANIVSGYRSYQT